MMISGINVNIATTLEAVDKDWAAQLAIYQWVLGAVPPSRGFVGIEQIVCSPASGAGRPSIRVASHRCRIDAGFQLTLMSRIAEIWDAIQSGTVIEASRGTVLDNQYAAFVEATSGGATPENEAWLQGVIRHG